MGGGKSGGNEADQARKDEAARQATVRAGTNRINAIFDGGTSSDLVSPTGQPIDFSTGNYYDANGNKLTGKLTKFDNEQVYSAPKSDPGQFTDDFYNKQKQAYIDYATPQLEDQYADAQKQLTYALARGGLLDSSVRGQKAGELQQQYDLNKQQIGDQALTYETNAKNSVEDARANLISSLNATGDAQGTVNSAISRASALSAPPTYSPLTQLFTDFTSALGTQAAVDKANALSGGGTTSTNGTGLFAPNSNAVKVVR